MNAMEAMKRKKEGGKIERKLSNGLTEVKTFRDNGQISYHYLLNENREYHGEYKWWWKDGTLGEQSNFKNGKLHGEFKWWWDGTLEEHELWEDGKLIKDYLKEN